MMVEQCYSISECYRRKIEVSRYGLSCSCDLVKMEEGRFAALSAREVCYGRENLNSS